MAQTKIGFSVKQEEFNQALQLVLRAVSSKITLPILSNFLIEVETNKIIVSSTNLDVAISVYLSATNTELGKIAVPGKILNDLVSTLNPGDLRLEVIDGVGSLSSGKFAAKINTAPVDDYPVIPSESGEARVSIPAKTLSLAINRVEFAAAIDESRPILAGVLFDLNEKGLELVATDGYRLSYAKFEREFKTPIKIVVPAKTLQEVSKIASIGDEIGIWLSENDKQVVFRTGNVKIVSRIIEGEYPNWRKIVPDSFNTKMLINKDEFARALTQAAVFAKESGNVVKLSLGEGLGLVVSSVSRELGEEKNEIEGEMAGPSGEIAFNWRYLNDFLGVCESEKFYLEMLESLKPGKFTLEKNESGVEFMHIIMPVRLQE
ncbi:DNA polymerase III subunit beta [Candidatus Curtissbacteria bacterium]|nr:DNA polymerase III subunit beta [Candidatus Curtissbacteria bacterium]